MSRRPRKGPLPRSSRRGSTQDRFLHTDRQHSRHGVVILILVQVTELRKEADRGVAHRCFVRMHYKSCLSKQSYPIRLSEPIDIGAPVPLHQIPQPLRIAQTVEYLVGIEL